MRFVKAFFYNTYLVNGEARTEFTSKKFWFQVIMLIASISFAMMACFEWYLIAHYEKGSSDWQAIVAIGGLMKAFAIALAHTYVKGKAVDAGPVVPRTRSPEDNR